MSKEYIEITWSVGTTLKEWLRFIEWEPLPKRLSDLLNQISEQDNKEAPEQGHSQKIAQRDQQPAISSKANPAHLTH
jgi:hypothetical protein